MAYSCQWIRYDGAGVVFSRCRTGRQRVLMLWHPDWYGWLLVTLSSGVHCWVHHHSFTSFVVGCEFSFSPWLFCILLLSRSQFVVYRRRALLVSKWVCGYACTCRGLSGSSVTERERQVGHFGRMDCVLFGTLYGRGLLMYSAAWRALSATCVWIQRDSEAVDPPPGSLSVPDDYDIDLVEEGKWHLSDVLPPGEINVRLS